MAPPVNQSLRYLGKSCAVAKVAVRLSSSVPYRTRSSLQFMPTRRVRLSDTTVADDEIVRSLKVCVCVRAYER